MRKRPTTRKAPPNQHAVLIRLPRPLHRQLRDKAQDENRSVNAHVRHLIEKDVEPEREAA